MAGGGGVPGGGGKRSVNAELNLIPFIDLLSTLICFLLITAVWQQIAALSTNSSSTTSAENPQLETEKKVALSVSLMMDHLLVSEDSKNTKLQHVNGDPDYAGLLNILRDWKGRFPTRSDVVVNSDSQAPYKHLIRLMDTMVEGQFDDVGVNTN